MKSSDPVSRPGKRLGAKIPGLGSGLWILHALVLILSLFGPAIILVNTFVGEDGFSLAAWQNVFADRVRWAILLAKTGSVAMVAVGVSCLMGVSVAVLVFKVAVRGRHFAAALLLLAAAFPLYAVGGAALTFTGLDSLRGSTAAVGLIHGLAHIPIVAIIVGMGLRSVPAAAEESAIIDGASPCQAFARITLPMAAGSVVAGVIIVLLWVLTDYSISDILLVRTFAEEAYTQYALRGRPAEPALVCVPQMMLFGGVLWAGRRIFLRCDESPTAGRVGFLFRTGRWSAAISLGAVLIPVTFVAVMTIALIVSLADGPSAWQVASWFVEEVATSLLTGLAAGMVCAAMAVGIAWTLVRRPRWRTVLSVYVVAALAIPAPILGMGMIRMFNHPGWLGSIYDSPMILVCAYVFRFLPIAVILLIPAVRSLPVECESAAQVDGASTTSIWLRLVWPQCIHSVLIALLIVTVLAVGELPCSQLVTPPGYITVGARFFSLVHYGMYADATMLCLLSMGSVVLPVGAIFVLIRKWVGLRYR